MSSPLIKRTSFKDSILPSLITSIQEDTPLINIDEEKYVPYTNDDSSESTVDSTGESYQAKLKSFRHNYLGKDDSNNEEENEKSADDDQMSKATTKDEELQNKKVPKPKRSFWSAFDKNVVQFALRIACMITFCSLFCLVRSDSYVHPLGVWIVISGLMVSWFPSLDAASVIEKMLQRIAGTIIGACLGICTGLFSVYILPSSISPQWFLGVCIFIETFGVICVSGHFRIGEGTSLKKFSYATMLCIMTLGISMLPFAYDEKPKWKKGLWRFINVTLGCLIGALFAVLVHPKSTTDIMYQRTARQVKLAGEACEALLHTASDFFGGISPEFMAMSLGGDINGSYNPKSPLESSFRWKMLRSTVRKGHNHDKSMEKAYLALKKYEDSITDLRAINALFPLKKYDPFAMLPANEENDVKRKIQKEIARTLVRALRIQTTIVVLDGMLRNDAEYDFTEKQIILFDESGTLIREMLTLPLDTSKSDVSAKKLFQKLEATRQDILHVSQNLSKKEIREDEIVRDQSIRNFRESIVGNRKDDLFALMRTQEDEMGREIPVNATGSHDNTLFFLQLLEHLILRALRLYQAWKLVEALKQTKDSD